MKRKIKNIIVILVLGLALGMLAQVSCQARAGGGGSGGSGGSGGGSGSSGSHSGSHSYGRSRGNSMVAFLAQGVIIAAACSGSIVFVWKVRKASKESKQQIKAYEKSDENWNYREMQNYVEEGYYRIQECWRRQDPDYAKDYLSQSLLENWKVKLSWMAMRDEEEIQENVQLLSVKPVHVKNPEGTQEDEVWYVIHGKMKDYRVRKSTGQFLEGNRKPVDFYEYWRFIYEDERWKLDEILQKEDVDIEELYK